VKLGANFQATSGNFWDNKYNPGVTGGVIIGTHKNRIGVRGEVLIGMCTYQSTYADSATGIKPHLSGVTLTIPILLEYKVLPVLTLLAGPQYSNLISMKSTNIGLGDPKVFFKASEFSAVVGLEAKLPKNFLVGARFIAGLTDINNGQVTPAANESWKNTTFQGYVGYRIK
jgi:hypothetical protein